MTDGIFSLCQGGRGVHQRGGEAAANARVPAQGVAAVRVPGEFAGRQSRRHHLSVRHPSVHRHILPRDAAGVQTLQSLQHDHQRNQDRGGRSARYYGPLLSYRNYMYHMVHVRTVGAFPRLS